MKVLIVGNGGREHALLWKLAGDNPESEFFVTLGNGGTAEQARHIPISPTDVEGVSGFVEKEGIDLTVVGPEVPLAMGLVDILEAKGRKVFGPTSKAAMIETNKAFAKDLMRKHGVPTSDYVTLRDYADARKYVETCDIPVVIKASGLAAGKGAMVCETREEAFDALSSIMREHRFGEAGDEVVIEEFMHGEELSIFCLTDGDNILPMLPSQDHKRIFDGDRGPNTGGMGAYAPVSIADRALLQHVEADIFRPVIRAMAERGTPYRGLLYAGLMLTAEGPKVVEFNCRFGDPETQVVVPLLDGNLLDLMVGVSEGKLVTADLSWKEMRAVCVVLAASGYPGSYEKGEQIRLEEGVGDMKDVFLFHAGTAMDGERLVTSGGRVIGVTALAEDVRGAIEKAYRACDGVRFEGKYCRRDIGRRELKREEISSS